MSTETGKFRFEISLTVLNALGRNLYRNLITILGEAISNSWDADATNVWITIDKAKSKIIIMDDGIGMDEQDFQHKFLKIGYSKRKNIGEKSTKSRPFIGAKGIGKLALLSCAEKISIFTKKHDTEHYIGGVIDNSELENAIKGDKTTEEYPLTAPNIKLISSLKDKIKTGTIIILDGVNDSNIHTIEYLRKLLALNFRFSLFDKEFNIYLNDKIINIGDLNSLIDSTQFVWIINDYKDEYIEKFTSKGIMLFHINDKDSTPLGIKNKVKGFIASVTKPKGLLLGRKNEKGNSERASIDLFVNGRLREKNILSHIPTQRIVEDYLYGQIHFDELERVGTDPFTSSREGIIETNSLFQDLLQHLKLLLTKKIFDEWDKHRTKVGDTGDDENEQTPKEKRQAENLYSTTFKKFSDNLDNKSKKILSKWENKYKKHAVSNLNHYINCFLAENIIREYIIRFEKSIPENLKKLAKDWEKKEKSALSKANINIPIRNNMRDGLSYMGMTELAEIVEGGKNKDLAASLNRDALSYTPIRNVIGHTGILTDEAGKYFEATYNNICGRIIDLLKENFKETEPRDHRK